MSEIIQEMTKEEFRSVLDDYFAPTEQRRQMTDQEVKDLADRLNQRIDVPLLKELGERKVLIKMVLKIDHFLYNYLPNEIYDLVRSLDHGISDSEAKHLITRISKLANKEINLVYLPEAAEYIVIRFVISVIMNAARRDWDFNFAKDRSDQELEDILSC